MNGNTNQLQQNPVKSTNPAPKIILISVLLAGILVVALLICKWPFTKSRVLSSINNPQNIISDTNSNTLEIFYYTVDDLSQNTQYKIFKVSPNLEESDINTHSFTIPGHYPPIITTSWKKSTLLFIANSETQSVIYSLDVSLRNSQPQPLITMPLDNNKGEIVKNTRYINDDTLAFITADGKNEQYENSVLNIVSLKDQQKKESYQLSEKSPLYAGFGFLAVTPDGKTIYLHETGGDADRVWSQWYKIDRDTRIVQKLEKLPPIIKGGDNPVVSVFSPDKTKIAYADFSAVVDQADLDQESKDGYFSQCLNDKSLLQKYASLGGTIIVQNLNIDKTDEIFRNLSYENNFCKNIGSRIISLKWLDNFHLAFETIDGIYAIDINTKNKETLFTFEQTNSPGEQTRPSIKLIQLPFIFFSDGSILQTNTNKQLKIKVFTPEGQRGDFFIFE